MYFYRDITVYIEYMHYVQVCQEGMENSDEFRDFEEVMKERFRFSRKQSGYFRHMPIQDFDKKCGETRKNGIG